MGKAGKKITVFTVHKKRGKFVRDFVGWVERDWWNRRRDLQVVSMLRLLADV